MILIFDPTIVQLPPTRVVYAYMNDQIFKVFGAAILVFELLLVLVFCIGLPRLARTGPVVEGLPLFFGFLLIATVIAIGLIRLQRWAAVTASTLGLAWSVVMASALGHAPWQSSIVGLPIVFGMLLPLYATLKNWSKLKAASDASLKSFLDALQSSDPLHLR